MSAVLTPNLLAVCDAGAFTDTDLETRKAIQRTSISVIDLTAELEKFEVKDAAGAAKMNDLLAILAREEKDIEAMRMGLTKPLKTKAKNIEDAFRPLSTAIDALKAVGKRKQLDWHRAEQARVERERAEAERIRKEAERAAFEAQAAAIAQSAQTGKPVELPAPVAVVVPVVAEASRGVKTDYGTTTVRKTWKFEVTDPALVPRQFLSVDDQAIRRAIAEGARTIEGVRIYQEEQLSVRAS